MMNKDKKNKIIGKGIGFEILSRDENSVTYKRVIPAKNRSKKKLKSIELGLPKVTVTCFDREDFFKLREIGNEIYKTYQVEQKSSVNKVIKDVRDFIIK